MKALHWLTWIFILVLVDSPVEGATQPREQVSDTYTLTTGSATPTPTPSRTVTRTPKRTVTATRTVMSSPTPGPTRKATSVHTATPVSGATTVAPATPTLGPTATETFTPTPAAPTLTPGVHYTPWPDAPLCPDTGHHHHVDVFHTLWDALRGCHYDHEHGENPFTPEVAAAFPGFDLLALLCGQEIGHCVPSSSMENTHKHGGFKWQVVINHPHACEGYEGSTYGVDAAVIQFHAFGDYSVEMESRIHSALSFVRQCSLSNPNDKGYIFVDQHVDYGQRVSGYQGMTMPYPDNPSPAYGSGFAPYFTIDCVSCGNKYDTRAAVVASNSNSSTTWTSEPDNLNGSGSRLLQLLFRSRDLYQVLDRSDVVYPLTFLWLCSSDGGATYDPAMPGCRWNNSTVGVHEIYGVIPASWDNLAGFDTDPRVGRITAEGYVTRFGVLALSCTAPGPGCHPIKMVQAFVGFYGSLLIASKEGQFTAVGLPERDIYFCGATQGRVCSETSVGSVSSGWIGSEN